MKRTLGLALALSIATAAVAQDSMPSGNPYAPPQGFAPPPSFPIALPFPLPLPFPVPLPFPPGLVTQPGQGPKPYTMSRMLPPQQKQMMMSMMMPIMNMMPGMSMKEAMNYAAVKHRAKPGLSFDDVVESMMLRANKVNFKLVGSNLLWKDFRAVLDDKEAPRTEVYSFCDIAVGRDLLKISPEFIVFLPCRIAVMEDADKNIWVLSIDWDLNWLGEYRARMGITDDLHAGALDIRKKMDEIMMAAVNGDL